MRKFSKNPNNVYNSVVKALNGLTPDILCQRSFEYMKKNKEHEYFYQWWCERFVTFASYQVWNKFSNEKEAFREKEAFLKKFA